MDKNFKLSLYGTVLFLIVVLVLGIVNSTRKSEVGGKAALVEQLSEEENLKKYGNSYGSASHAPVGVKARAAIHKSTHAYYFPKTKRKYVDPFINDEKLDAGQMYEDVSVLHENVDYENINDSVFFEDQEKEPEPQANYGNEFQKLPGDSDKMPYEPLIKNIKESSEESTKDVLDETTEEKL